MAYVPLSGTDIRLLSGIPFNNDYKNARWFTNRDEQVNWFMSQNTRYTDSEANFQRIEGKHFIAVKKSIDDLWGTNYLMFKNTEYKNKWFFAFVTQLEYKQRNNTHVYFEIDVLQTWRFQMTFRRSFVVREHRPLWNSDGTPVINTIDEGLNYGTDYETVSIDHYQPYGDNFFLVVVAKEKFHVQAGETLEKEITPTLNGLPQPLSYYIHPFKKDGTLPNVKVGGDLEISGILDFLKGVFTQDGAVNNIVSAYVTDYTGLPLAYNSSTDTIGFSPTNATEALISDDKNLNITTIYVKDSANYTRDSKVYPNKYSDYSNVTESKLLMHPYTVLVLDDFRGNRVEIKNEYIDTKEIELMVMGSMGTSNKVSYGILDYLTKKIDSVADKQRLNLEYALVNENPNDLPIINDYLSAYLQGNRNSLANQRDSIKWNGVLNALGSVGGGVVSGRAGKGAGVYSAGVDVVKGAGNTVIDLQSIEAKIKDVDNTPPSMSKMGSNVYFDYGNNYSGVYLIKKQILPEYRKILGDFFNMFGYKTNQVKVPNLHTRKNWNYVQTLGCNITGSFNNEDLQELKTVFDNGITLWHSDNIGRYDLDNGVI